MYLDPVHVTELCVYFEGGDADGTFERRPVEFNAKIIGGPGPSRSTYEQTDRTIRGNGDTWQVWTHRGDWRAARPITDD